MASRRKTPRQRRDGIVPAASAGPVRRFTVRFPRPITRAHGHVLTEHGWVREQTKQQNEE